MSKQNINQKSIGSPSEKTDLFTQTTDFTVKENDL